MFSSVLFKKGIACMFLLTQTILCMQ
uniref:Uncharacterized protein n=1 Tax=Anguilla anguilla TaxID=7936 RepID=A0A0E9XTI7_ANGAN